MTWQELAGREPRGPPLLRGSQPRAECTSHTVGSACPRILKTSLVGCGPWFTFRKRQVNLTGKENEFSLGIWVVFNHAGEGDLYSTEPTLKCSSHPEAPSQTHPIVMFSLASRGQTDSEINHHGMIADHRLYGSQSDHDPTTLKKQCLSQVWLNWP